MTINPQGTTNGATKAHVRAKSKTTNSPSLNKGMHGGSWLDTLKKRVADASENLDSEQVWLGSHLIFLVHVLLFVLGFGTSSNTSSHILTGLTSLWTWEAFYSRACYALVTAHGISAYRAMLAIKQKLELTGSQGSGPNVQQLLGHMMLTDANVLYFALAVWLTLTSPFGPVFYSMAVYSFYHLASHVRNAKVAVGSLPERLMKAIVLPALSLQNNVLLMCAHVEIVALPILLFRMIFVGSTGILALALYFQFLRFQYASSGRTRMAFRELNLFFGKTLAHPSLPRYWLGYYEKLAIALAKLVPEYKRDN